MRLVTTATPKPSGLARCWRFARMSANTW